MRHTAHYLQRIGRVLALVEARAESGEWPDLSQMAEAAAMSEFHFHRIFRLMTGETPQQTVARARLGGSLPALAGAEGIAAATERSAYATSQSYARALKALTSASPTQLRDDPERFAEVVEALVRPAAAAAGDPPVAVEIAQLTPLRLVAVRKTGDYKELNTGYHRLFDLLMARIAPEQVTGLYGVPHDDPRTTPAEECRFDCAVTTAVDVPEEDGLAHLDIAGGTALRLRIPGDYDGVHAALDHLYLLAIALDLPLADSLPVNYYHHDPEEVAEEHLVTDIHLVLAE